MGAMYSRRQREQEWFSQALSPEREQFVVKRVRELVEKAIVSVPFYRELYANARVVPSSIRSIADIVYLPVVTKARLADRPLEERSTVKFGRTLVNTGGSSGQTLAFYIQPSSIPNEWAHMHGIWAKLGYRPSELKLYFGGRYNGEKVIWYDGLRHQYAANIYKPWKDVADSLRPLLTSRTFRYLHGYPSVLYDFACYCEQEAPDLVERMCKTIRGAFLASEFPQPVYRDKIESVFQIPSVSWYGHTERAVLAGELKEPFVYYPFQTYGYCESVPEEGTGRHKLVATSYCNEASPFIRYDTGDYIEPVEYEGEILKSFRIAEGREGDFVSDRTGKLIPLTSLIFGRHHSAFNQVRFVQIREDAPGRVTLLVTPKEGAAEIRNWRKSFDLDGVDIEFTFETLTTPVLSPAGKVVLKVQSDLKL